VSRRVEIALGGLALLAVGANVTWHAQQGTWFDAFWLCNGATVLAGLGLLLRAPLLGTAAFVWLVPGTLAWAVEALFLGSSFPPPSYGLHLGGVAAAVYAVYRLGAHRAGYLGGLALFSALVLLSRALPEEANVNCAFGPRASWKAWAGLGLPHHLTIALLALAITYGMNRVALAWITSARSRFPDPRS
jgi:hypothetical protein